MDLKSKLIDHLLVLGVDTDKEKITAKSINENTVTPSLLEIYPPTEKGVGIPRYLENCNLWGFENGFKLYDQNLNIIYGRDDRYKPTPLASEKNIMNKRIETKNRMYSFVMTDEHYCKRYCTSLLFHEPYFLQNDDHSSIKEEHSFRKDDISASIRLNQQEFSENDLIYIPKSISVVSARPCFETQRMILKYLYGDLLGTKDRDYCDKKIRIPTRYLWNLGCLIKDVQGGLSPGQEGDIDRQSEKIFEYNRDLHFQGLGKEEEVIVHESQLKEFYFSAVFSLLEIPKKPMDKVVLKLHIEDENHEMIRYRIPKKNGLYLPETNYKVLLRRLSPKNIVRVFKYILLEKQIIFFSSRPEEIPYVTEAFLSLISPLSWCCLYVPFLPIAMWEILHAVMPFIVGVSSRYKEFVANQIDLTDKIVVDLDDDALFIGEDSCEFPKEPQTFLIKELEPICSRSRKADPKKSRELWVELTLKTRHLFNIALLTIINNYLVFFKQSKGKTGNAQKNSASEVFLLENYLSQFPSSDSYFMREFSSTMVFINLMEESYRLIYSDRNMNAKGMTDPDNVEEIATFIEQLKAMTAFSFTDTNIHHVNKTYLFLLNPKAIEHMGIVNSDSIKQSTQRYYSPEIIDLFPYLIKYYFRFFLSQKDRIKLLASPMSFKSSNPVSQDDPYSPELCKDYLNKEIQFFIPLNKSKIVDLNKVFAPSPKPTQNQNNQIICCSDPLSKTDSHNTFSPTCPVYEERQGNVTAPSKLRNPNFLDQEKRFSIEHTPVPVPEKIDVQIDYNQLAQLNNYNFNDTSTSLGKLSFQPSRYSMPGENNSQSYDIPRQNSYPLGLNQDNLNNTKIPSRYSMPEETLEQGYEIPRQNSNPVKFVRDTALEYNPMRSSMPEQSLLNKQPHLHHMQSVPTTINEIKEYNNHEKSPSMINPNGSFVKGEDRTGQIKWEIREFGMEEPKKIFSSRPKRHQEKSEEELKLYNSLHIPRKASDTSYRIYGRINTDDSLRLSMNSLDQGLPKDNRPLGRKNMIFSSKQEVGDLLKTNEGNNWHGQTDFIPPKLKSREDSRKKIFENKDKYLSVPVYGYDAKERVLTDEPIIGKVDLRRSNDFNKKV